MLQRPSVPSSLQTARSPDTSGLRALLASVSRRSCPLSTLRTRMSAWSVTTRATRDMSGSPDVSAPTGLLRRASSYTTQRPSVRADDWSSRASLTVNRSTLGRDSDWANVAAHVVKSIDAITISTMSKWVAALIARSFRDVTVPLALMGRTG